MKKLLKRILSVASVLALSLSVSVVAFANNNTDAPWDFNLSYWDSVTAARTKQDSSASYVKYNAGKYATIRTAIYNSLGKNCTTNAGNVVLVNVGQEKFISNSGFSQANKNVTLHLCTQSVLESGNANGVWSADNYDKIP